VRRTLFCPVEERLCDRPICTAKGCTKLHKNECRKIRHQQQNLDGICENVKQVLNLWTCQGVDFASWKGRPTKVYMSSSISFHSQQSQSVWGWVIDPKKRRTERSDPKLTSHVLSAQLLVEMCRLYSPTASAWEPAYGCFIVRLFTGVIKSISIDVMG